jgi:hypothetical protein
MKIRVQVDPITSLEKLLPTLSHRMQRLLEILKSYGPSSRERSGIKEGLSCLIFVDQRFVAYMINVCCCFNVLFLSVHCVIDASEGPCKVGICRFWVSQG